MSVQARVLDNFMYDGVKVAVRLSADGSRATALQWVDPVEVVIDRDAVPPDNTLLRLSEDVARAIYEALSVHFGGNVVDATRLRKDYDAERARVDVFIKHLTEKAS